MDWETKEKERQVKIEEERKRLLGMSEVEASRLPHPEWYQRIRYLREKESQEWLAELRRKMPAQPVEPLNVERRRASSMAPIKKFKSWMD